MRVLITGRTPAFRALKRTHGYTLSYAHHRVLSDDVNLLDCVTDCMAADIFTKHSINPQHWVHACQLIGVLDGKRIAKLKSKAKMLPTGVLPSPACVAITCRPALPVPPRPGESACVSYTNQKIPSVTVATQDRENTRTAPYAMCEICDAHTNRRDMPNMLNWIVY